MKVSVILTSYNHAQYLRESIDSVLNQAFSDFEFLILDDASEDDSWNIITSYSDPRIQVFRNNSNRGVDFSGRGPQAVGEYIAIHHSDDVWEPEKLQKQVDFLDAHPEIGAVFTHAQIIGEDGKPLEDKTHFYYKIFDQPNRSRHEWLNFFFYNGNALCHPSVLIRKKCYEDCGGYRKGLIQLPDFDMWIRLCLQYEIHVMQEKLVRFRVQQNEMNASGNRPEVRIRWQFEYLQLLENYLKISTYPELVKIFPEAQKYYRKSGCDLGYVLGRVSLETSGPTFRQLFGLNLLFKAINDPDRKKRIEKLYGFSQKDFFALTAKYDVFSVEVKNYLSSQLAAKEQTIQALTIQVSEKEQAVQVLNNSLSEKEQELIRLNQAAAEKEEQITSLGQVVAERDAQIERLKEDNFLRGEWALRLDRERKDAESRIAQIMASNSWKITEPLREIRRWRTNPKAQGRQYLKKIVEKSITFYKCLPLSQQTKTAHRLIVAKYFPGILRVTNQLPVGPQEVLHTVTTPNPHESGTSRPSYGPPETISPLQVPVIPDPAAVAQKEAGRAPVSFPVVDEPLVSVVIPVYNNFEYTWACLQSLQANSGDVSFEIIIVDDGSSDATTKNFPSLAGVRYVRNDRNLGFLTSCNRGAELARGKYLVLLNNDTEVRPGWLQALLGTFLDDPRAGLVGSKFIFPDGRLLEAGGIVWRDGSACNYGRGGHPDDPRVNYRREVDYVSGACIMLPRDLFLSLGGFDDKFSPAYYEDTDLAFRVRAAGRKVIYQPLSEIVHYEGVTSGTDTSQGVKHYQIINQKTFYERWKDILAAHGEPGLHHEWEKERKIGLRILVVDECICLPDQDSGSVRMLNILRILQELGHKVTFFPDNAYYPEPYTSRMRGMGVEVLTTDAAPALETHLAAWGELYDLVLLSRIDVARRHVDAVTRHCSRAFLYFDTVDLHFLREEREAALKGDPQAIQAARQRRDEELGVAARADLTLVVSEAERDLLARECPDLPVAVLSNIHDVAGCRMPFDDRKDILFVGGFRHTPNVDAAVFFVREVFPRLRRLLPHIRFHIVGSNPPGEVLALAGEGVEVHGFVPDLAPFLDRCRISVAPLRWGAGVKGKINQSMSYGLPVVATTVAAEGMFLKDGEEVLVADGPDALADAVARLYSDPKLWERLSQGGLANVRRYFSFDVARNALAAILERVTSGSPDGKSPDAKPVVPANVGAEEATSRENRQNARLIAFFLPQFHPIPENDEWWGEGFTEWHNVTRARPLFRGHEQPKLPADLGFYDLRLPEVRARQADLARTYGFEAFCYWHYWFGGKRLLDRPFTEVLESGEPDFSFCLAWANEPWSRRWDGEAHHILQPQKYGGEDDDRRHFECLLPALRDPRAVRVDDLPVFLIYKARDLPDAARTVALWRKLARENGLPGLHLLSIETTGSFGWDPREAGFDAAVEFQPHWERIVAFTRSLDRLRRDLDDKRYGSVWTVDYAEIWPRLCGDTPSYPRYPGICPRWDNTPRKGRTGLVFRNSTPEEYGRWLANIVAKVQTQPPDRRLVFINAWNEWAEGNYLEPDQTYGHAYLEATLRAVKNGGKFK
jgi:GT2 family glycosyltransferase